MLNLFKVKVEEGRDDVGKGRVTELGKGRDREKGETKGRTV